MIKVIYNEGQGFTEQTKIYNSLNEAIMKEGFNNMLNTHIYKNNQRIH